MFAIASGIFWSIAYGLIIRRGFRDRTCGMPMAALCLNLSWEFIFAFVFPHRGPQRSIDILWFGLDLVIAYQCLRFGRSGGASVWRKRLFYPLFIALLAVSFGVILFFTREFNNLEGYYTAFGQNLLMSILFVFMLLDREGIAGQSLYIAAAKMLGTLSASMIVLRSMASSGLMVFFCIAILGFDLSYIGLLYWKGLSLGINPWKRL